VLGGGGGDLLGYLFAPNVGDGPINVAPSKQNKIVGAPMN